MLLSLFPSSDLLLVLPPSGSFTSQIKRGGGEEVDEWLITSVLLELSLMRLPAPQPIHRYNSPPSLARSRSREHFENAIGNRAWHDETHISYPTQTSAMFPGAPLPAFHFLPLIQSQPSGKSKTPCS